MLTVINLFEDKDKDKTPAQVTVSCAGVYEILGRAAQAKEQDKPKK